MSTVKIEIPKSSDKNFGYLNMASKYPFNLEGKSWPSVEHYILAKQFEGTTLEEEIRTTKTILAARILARPKPCIVTRDGENAGVERKILYGRDSTFQKRGGWGTEMIPYLSEATKSKFEQNPNIKAKLMKTDGMEIVSSDCNGVVYAKILMDIRNDLLKLAGGKPKTKPKTWLKMTAADTDILGSGGIEAKERIFIEKILKVLTWIRKIEKCTKVHPEMLEDVFYNILGPEKFCLVEMWKEHNSSIAEKWSLVAKTSPKYEKITRSISDMLSPTPFEDSGSKILCSIFISTVIRWLRSDGFRISNEIFDATEKLSFSDVVLPPIQRSYRNSNLDAPVKTPAKPPKKEKGAVRTPKCVSKDDTNLVNGEELHTEQAYTERGVMYIKLFAKYKNVLAGKKYSALLDHLEAMDDASRDAWLTRFKSSDENVKLTILASFSS